MADYSDPSAWRREAERERKLRDEYWLKAYHRSIGYVYICLLCDVEVASESTKHRKWHESRGERLDEI